MPKIRGRWKNAERSTLGTQCELGNGTLSKLKIWTKRKLKPGMCIRYLETSKATRNKKQIEKSCKNMPTHKDTKKVFFTTWFLKGFTARISSLHGGNSCPVPHCLPKLLPLQTANYGLWTPSNPFGPLPNANCSNGANHAFPQPHPAKCIVKIRIKSGMQLLKNVRPKTLQSFNLQYIMPESFENAEFCSALNLCLKTVQHPKAHGMVQFPGTGC